MRLHGEECKTAKLKAADVLEICRLYASGDYTLKGLGEKFGVSISQIFRIVSGEDWKHVTGGRITEKKREKKGHQR